MTWTVPALAILALGGCLSSTSLGGGSDFASGSAGVGGNALGEGPELPKCTAPLGTVALVEDQSRSFYRFGVEDPRTVLRLLIAQSGCFNIVDRGQGLTAVRQEEQLTGGKGQGDQNLIRAQYYLSSELVTSDSDTGGGAFGLGGLIPGGLGSTLSGLAGGVGLQQAEAQVVMFLTQTDSGLQVAAAEGSAKNSDLALAGASWLGRMGGGASAYASTDQGKVVVAALVDGLNKLVLQLRSQGATG